MAYKELTTDQLLHENEELRSRLAEAEEALDAIRNGEVDAIVVSGKEGEQIFSLSSAETPYRLLLEEMDEGAITAYADGTILYCNKRFAQIVSQPVERIVGSNCRNFIAESERNMFDNLLKEGMKGTANGVIAFHNNRSESIVHLKLSVTALPSSMTGDICIVASDVSQMIHQKEKLEFLVKKRTEEILKASKKLQKDILAIRKSKAALRESENKYTTIYNAMSEGFALHKLIHDSTGKPIDYIITDVNPAFEKIVGLKKKRTIGRKATEVYSVNAAPFLDIYSEVALKRNPVSFESYFPPLNKYFQISVFSPSKGRFATVFQDITERKKTEESLKRSEQLYRAIGESIDYGIWICDADGKNTYASESYLKLVGLTQEQCSKFGWGGTLHPDDAERTIDAWKECSRTGDIWDVEHRFRGVDGKWHPILARGVPIRDNDGNIIYWAGINLDISKIKQTEEALRISEERFRSIINNSLDVIYRINLQSGVYEYISPSVEAVMGYSAAELMSIGPISSISMVHPDDVVMIREAHIQSEATGKGKAEYRQRSKSGEYRWISNHMSLVRDAESRPLYRDGNIRDITEQKKAEQILKESEERFRNLVKYAPAAIYEMDLQGKRFYSVNDAMCKILGYTREELLTVKPIELLEQSSRSLFRERINRQLNNLPIDEDVEYIVRKKNGDVIYVLITIGNIFYSDDTKPRVTVVAYNITERRRKEEILKESEKRFRELVKYAPTAIYEIDFLTRKFISVNDSMCKLSGYSREELLSIDSLDLLEEDSKKLFLARISKSLKGEEPDENVEYRVKSRNGLIIDAVLNMKFNFNDRGIPVGAMVVGHDITERKITERELRKSEEALKESEEKLWSVLNATQESVYMFDRESRFTMANSTGLRRLKITAENELLGHHFSEFMPSSLAELRQEKLDEVFSTGQPIEFVDERNGRMFSHNFFPVFKDNIVSSVVTYSTDITERRRAEVNLKESEDRFRTIAESLPVLILIYSVTKSTILFVNESFEKTFGYKKNDLMNRKVPPLFINPDENSVIGEELRKKGRVYNKQIKVKKTDGSQFWIMASIRKILFMNEPAYLSAAIDITETKKVQDELLRLNRILDANSSSSHAMMHSNNEFSFLNNVCRIIIEVCGYKMVWVGYAENDEHKSVKPVAYYGFEQGYIDQMNITWNDDGKRGNGPTGTAIRTGKPSVCRNMLTDPKFEPWREAAIERGYSSSLVLPLISEKKAFGAISIYSEDPDPFSRSEIKLLTDLAADLAYGISFIRLAESERASAKAVKESEVKLKELVATKDKFFNIVAHDLKNPFTSLLGSSELLYDNINHMTPESVRELALILNDSAKGGYAILQNLLDWSRSQTGLLKFNPEKVNLKSIIDENIENLQLQVNNKGLNIKSEVTKDLHVLSDKNMINTILRNLLSNAVKYTHKNGTVLIRTSKTRKNVIVTVRDSGTGIPKEKVATLFRLENSLSTPGTAKEQGTGLGLKLCKEFTEKMGGRIWVDSEEGKGSEFKFSIPLSNIKA